MAVYNARNCKVFIDGMDISVMVRALQVRANVNEVCTISLELYGLPVIDTDGAIHIHSGAVHSEAVALPARGILIRSDK